MSHLQYFSYPGFGEWAAENFHYNQAVRIGDLIKLSGQGKFWSIYLAALIPHIHHIASTVSNTSIVHRRHKPRNPNIPFRHLIRNSPSIL
jgi:hypothetical protein